MNKIRVIDLLNKIASGEKVPKEIRIDRLSYKFEWVEHLDIYYDKSADLDLRSALSMSKEELNYGVEIIEEEKKIEKIFGLHHPSTKSLDLIKEDIELAFETIDKLIDKVNKLEEGKK